MADVNAPKGSIARELAQADPEAASGPTRARRPYEPPAIEESSAFETLALNCTGLVNEQQCYQTYSYHNS